MCRMIFSRCKKTLDKRCKICYYDIAIISCGIQNAYGKGFGKMDNIFNDGKFFTGCNYWASHAGTNMWHDWKPEVIDNDFSLLAQANIKNLRVFPLWPDFQPIKMHYECKGVEREIRMGEEPLPFTEAGRAGVSEEMAERFGIFCDLAQKHGLKLVVGLLTGWMSGRLYVPPLLEKTNVLTDPRALKWEIKFVRYMVKRFKDHPAIVAWDLGNECNCMGDARNPDEAYLWASTITMAIKSEDNLRPVVSGMHSTYPEASFRPQDLGEILDIQCTHPYPLFTPHCDTDPIVENKSVMHAVAETLVFRGFGGKPAFAEEVGTLGPLMASEENAAAYINTIMHQLWSHNCMGIMWWCGFEQKHLKHTPYDWNAVERELGLFREDFTKKPVLEAMSDFTSFIESFENEFDRLPDRIVDAVCIITQKRDTWLPAFGTFLLAKQAGLDIEFCYEDSEIPNARAYIIPSINDNQGLQAHTMKTIMERVKNGAVLYQSIGAALLSPFDEYFGLKALIHYRPTEADRVELDSSVFNFRRTYKVVFEENGAKTLLTDGEGTPVMSEYAYGNGTVYFLAYDIENIAGGDAGVISGKHEIPLYKFYKAMGKLRNPEKCVLGDNPHVSYTEHIVDETRRIVVAINCVPRESKSSFAFDGYKLCRVLKNQDSLVEQTADGVALTMKPNSAVVLEIVAK